MKTLNRYHLLATIVLILVSFSGCGAGSSADIEYVAIGASDTAGIGASPPTNGWAYRVEDDLERSGKDTELENLGIPGAEISQLNNIERPFADFDDPDLITVFTGANDLVDGDDPAQFEEDLGVLLGGLEDDTNAILVIANLPDLTQLPRFRDEPDKDVTAQRIAAFNGAIVRQAAAHGALLVDLFSIPVQDSYVFDEDLFHPNDAGHKVIADAFLEVIRPIFIVPASPTATP